MFKVIDKKDLRSAKGYDIIMDWLEKHLGKSELNKMLTCMTQSKTYKRVPGSTGEDYIVNYEKL